MLQVGKRSDGSGPRPHRGSLARRDLELESQVQPLACPSEGTAPLAEGPVVFPSLVLGRDQKFGGSSCPEPPSWFPWSWGRGCRDTSEWTTVVTLGVQTGRVGTQGRSGNRNMGR